MPEQMTFDDAITIEETPVHMLARTHDPLTSHTAAASIDATRLEAIILDAITQAGEYGMTQDELLLMFPTLSYSSVTARPAALKRKGLIVDSGMFRNGRSGRKQSVLVAAGKSLLS